MRPTKILKPFTAFGIFVWLIASLFFFYEFAIRTFLGTLINQIVPALSINTEQYAFLGTTFYIFFGIMQIPSGTLTDHYGVKFPMFFGLITCTAGVILFAHADSYAAALTARAIMAIGASFAFICLLVIAGSWFSPRYFATMCGLSQFLGTLGPALATGPLINHMLTTHENWRHMLMTVALAGFIIALLILFTVSKGPFKSANSDISTDTFSIVLKKLLRNKQVIWVGIYSATNYCSISLFAEVWGTKFLETRHFTQGQANHIISMGWYAYAFGCPILGWLSDHLKNRRHIMLWSSALGFLAACAFLYVPAQQPLYFIITFSSIGFLAGGQNIGFAAITEFISPDLKAASLGFNNMTITILNLILPIFVGMIMSAVGGDQINSLTTKDMMTGLSVSPLIFLISSIVAMYLMGEPKKMQYKQA